MLSMVLERNATLNSGSVPAAATSACICNSSLPAVNDIDALRKVRLVSGLDFIKFAGRNMLTYKKSGNEEEDCSKEGERNIGFPFRACAGTSNSVPSPDAAAVEWPNKLVKVLLVVN
jgi:hypothetical protein